MAHFPKPFYREKRDLWYVQIHGKQVNLGSDKELAFKKYHEIMHRPTPVASELVAGMIEGFLDWAEQHLAASTYAGYKKFLNAFALSLPNPKTFPVEQLKPYHVQQWIDGRKAWGATMKHNAITAVKRCFSWGEKLGHISRSPIRSVEKPTPERRNQIVTVVHYETMLARVRSKTSKELLTILWETGARPQEFRIVEARHFNKEAGRFDIPPEEAKGKKRWRRIYLSAKALDIVNAKIKKYPTGPLFRNEDGKAWTVFAIDCLFKRLAPKLKVKYCAYDFRHTFATRMLVAGIDHLTVAEWLGHADGSTLARVYAHVDQRGDYMREKFNQVSGASV
jgi:integrase